MDCGDSPQATLETTARAIVIGTIDFSWAELDALEALDLMYIVINLMS